MAYEKYHETWENSPDTTTPVSAEALMHIEEGIAAAADVADAPTTWASVTGKPSTFPPVIGTGATDAVAGNDARLTAGAAGTATVRAIGTTATTAAAGNHTHTATTVTATAIAPGTATNVQAILAELAARIDALENP